MIRENKNLDFFRSLSLKEVPISNITRGVTIGTRLTCIDNTGTQIVEIIGVFHTGNTAKRNVSAGVGHIVKVAIKRGLNKGKMEIAMVTTTKRKFYRASEGIRIMFQKNTCVLIEKSNKIYNLKNTTIKHPVAKECIRTIPLIKKYATVL